MKWPSLIITSLLLTSSISLAAPIPRPANVEGLSGFEKELQQLEWQIQEQAEKRAKANKITKIATVSIGVAGIVGGIGYITSSAIPMAVLHRQRNNIYAFNEEVARANAAAEERARRKHERPSTFTIKPMTGPDSGTSQLDKRAVEQIVGTGMQAVEQGAKDLEHAGTTVADKDSLWDQRHPVWLPPHPVFPWKLPPAGAEKQTGHAAAETVENRMQLLQDTLVKMQKKQHLQPVRDKFGRWMLGLGAASAVVTLASAELVNENSVEYYMTWPKLADPSNLDKATCLKYAAKINSLDCSKAKSVDTKPASTPIGSGGLTVSRPSTQ